MMVSALSRNTVNGTMKEYLVTNAAGIIDIKKTFAEGLFVDSNKDGLLHLLVNATHQLQFLVQKIVIST